MSFHVGQKVVCVDVKPRGSIPVNLDKDQTYTVAGFIACADDIGILLEEVTATRPHCGFYAFRFRPVHTTSIEIFETMLAPKPVKELATQD